jgi:hypothetical protein
MNYVPLLPPGLHPKSLDEVRNICVDSFVKKERREILFGKFLDFLAFFSQTGLQAELWIDGSFLSEKPEPGDIDLVFLVERSDVKAQPIAIQAILYDIFTVGNDMKYRFDCDVYFAYKDDINRIKYWEDWFGKDRTGRQKGIISIQIQ